MTEISNTPADATPRNTLAVKLEAPVVLTPDQIQQIAAGAMVSSKGDLSLITRLGFWPRPPFKPTIPIANIPIANIK